MEEPGCGKDHHLPAVTGQVSGRAGDRTKTREFQAGARPLHAASVLSEAGAHGNKPNSAIQQAQQGSLCARNCEVLRTSSDTWT